jgi:hypothetical protein
MVLVLRHHLPPRRILHHQPSCACASTAQDFRLFGRQLRWRQVVGPTVFDVVKCTLANGMLQRASVGNLHYLGRESGGTRSQQNCKGSYHAMRNNKDAGTCARHRHDTGPRSIDVALGQPW